MSYHTGAVGACQSSGDNASPKTPPVDRRLVARYGAAALDDGYVAIPRVVIRRRRALGVTAAEWDYICEVWSYWRADRLPGPSVEDLAGGLGVDGSTVRRHRARLERKGLLRVVPVGNYNRYDLRALIDAAVAFDRAQGPHDAPDAPDAPPMPASSSGPPTSSQPPPRTSSPHDRAGLHATKKVEKNFDHDSIPPYPPLRGNARSHGDGPPGHAPDDDQVVAAAISALSSELGDDAPASSISRAGNLWGDAGVPCGRFLALIDEAATRTRGRQDRIIARGRDGGPSGMRYFFAVLADLLHPPPPRPHMATDRPYRGRADRPGRGRRRDGVARDRHCASSYDHYSEPPSGDISREWRDTLDELRGELTAENYRRWFLPTSVLGLEDGLLRIGVPDDFHQQWLDRRLRGAIERAMTRVTPNVRVAFEVAQIV